jgi:hypothetical protein
MLFNSPLFLFLFLPLVWVGFHLSARLNHRFAVAWLVGASLLFYGWWTPAYLILLCGSILFNYTVGRLIQKTIEKPSLQFTILTVGVAANLLLLGYYKYLFPLLHWLEQFGFHLVPPNSSVILPLGISFFTFTQIGYLIDCRAALTSGRRFLDYALFVTFFPHLIAGPILHHREMMPQFEDKETWRFDPTRLAVGLSIFFIGLAKKDVIADYFAVTAQFTFDHPTGVTTLQAWGGVLSYSLQLYFDFSGYSEMAIGLALLFNIRFPANPEAVHYYTMIVFMTMTVVIACAWAWVLMEPMSFLDSSYPILKAKMDMAANLPAGSVVILGDSRPLVGLIPAQLGPDVYNLAVSGASPIEVLAFARLTTPTLSKPHSPGLKWIKWEPTPAWGLAIGLIAALAVLAISGQSEFLYFRF